MRSFLFIAIFAVAIPLFAHGQTQPSATKKTVSPAQKSDPTEQTLIRLDRDIIDAVVRNDMATLNRIELDNAVFITPVGGVEQRGQPGTERPKIESIQTDDVRVHLHGDTAILTGRANLKGRFTNGPDISGPYRYMRVFVKRQGQWRVAATQATRIAEQPTPAPTP